MSALPAARFRFASLACALCAGLVLPPAGATQQLRLSVGAATDYVVYGVSRTLGDPAGQGELAVSGERGTSLGLWASTANLNPGPGATSELGAFLAQRYRLGLDWALNLRASKYWYPGDTTGLSYDYAELRAGIAFRDAVQLTVSYSPDWSAFTPAYGAATDRPALWTDLSAAFPLSSRATVSAGLGYADVSEHIGTGYLYFSAGFEWRWRSLTFGVSYVGTDGDGTRAFGTSRAGDRLIGSVVWQIR